MHTGEPDASDRPSPKSLPFVGCDRLTLTFPLADADLWRRDGDKLLWRSAEDRDLPDEDSSPWNREEEDVDDFDDEDDGPVELEQDEDGQQAAPPSGRAAPLTVLHRDLKFAGAHVHIRAWQRGDQWDEPGPRYIGEDRGDRWWASVSFNPSRVRDPKGWQLCPALEARTWACALLVQLARAQVVVPQCMHMNTLTAEHEDVELLFDDRTGAANDEERQLTGRWWCEDVYCLEQSVTVSRVDATMDFAGVLDTTTLVDVFMGHRQARAGTSKWRHSPVSASAAAGRTGHRVAIYDKFVQTRRPGRPVSAWAPPGTLRVEVMARARKLRKIMLPTHLRGADGLGRYSRRLAHLTPEFLTEMFLAGFVWAGLDRWYGGQHPLRPVSGKSLTATSAERLRDFLDERAAGRPRGEVADNTTRRYEHLAAQYGYVVGVPRGRNQGPLRHLDVVACTETRPGLEWRLERGLVGRDSGAAGPTAVRRLPRPPGWKRPPRRRPLRRDRSELAANVLFE